MQLSTDDAQATSFRFDSDYMRPKKQKTLYEGSFVFYERATGIPSKGG